MITFARKDEVAELKRLWLEAFGEDESATLFYNLAFEEIEVVVYKIQNEIVSMLHCIPCRLIGDKEEYNGVYLYALATDKRFRGQGIMGKLIENVKNNLKEDNMDFLYLIPADAGLYDYYGKYGFTDKVFMPENMKDLTDVISQKDKINLFFSDTIEEYTYMEVETFGIEEQVVEDLERVTNGLLMKFNAGCDVQKVAGLIPY